MKLSNLLAFALLFGAAGCARQDTSGTTVARIDNTVLTLEQVRAQFDSGSGVSDAQLQQYIQRWMNDELLFAEAQRRSLTQTPDIERHLVDLQRRLAIQALLDEEIYNTANAANSESEVREYFTAHRSEFTLNRDVVLVSFVLLNSRDAATEFRNAVLRGTSWTKALADLIAGAGASHVVTVADSAYYTQATLAPPELWRGAMNIKENEPSFPISTTAGYYVLIPWNVLRQGQTPDLGYARPEIEERLTIERRRRKYEGLLANLRASHDVQVLVSGVYPRPPRAQQPVKNRKRSTTMKNVARIALLFLSFSLSAQTMIDRIVAVVDKEIITASELDDRVMYYSLQNRVDAAQPGLKQQMLESMISEKLILAQAFIDSVVVTDEEISRTMDQRIASLVRQMGSEALVEQRYGKPLNRIRREYREEIRKQMLAQRVQQTHEASVTVSRREVEDFFAAYKDSLPQVPEEYELSHLFIVPKADSIVEVRTRAKLSAILDSIKAGGSFADFAKRYSVDGTAQNGGELPFTKRGELVHDFEEIAFGLKQEGEISGVVKTQYGLHIMQLIERRGESVRVRHILLKIEKTAEDDSACVQQLRDLKRRILAGEMFGDLAKKYSEDEETKSIGGDLGKVTADQLTPEFSVIVRTLNGGEISEPQRMTLGSSYGYHIVWLRKKTPTHTMTMATDFTRVEQLALYLKRNKQNVEWLDDLRKTIYVENRLDKP